MYIERYIENCTEGLKKLGKNYACKCPLHDDRRASMVVYPETESFYCFGCNKGGNLLRFISLETGCHYHEALRKVKDFFNDGFNEEYFTSIIGKRVEKSSDSTESIPLLTKDILLSFMKGENDGVKKGYISNNYRGMKDEYQKFYGHLTALENNEVVSQWYPETNSDGKLIGYKCRNHPKDFTKGKIGTVGSSSQLSGQSRFKGKGKYVLIVGGEIDKVSAYQMLYESQRERGQGDFDPIPVVSPTAGEGSAAKQCAAQYEWLNGFDIIVVGLDSDEAGKKATEAVCKVLPREKVKIATWSGKDPNQMLTDGKQKQFVRDFYAAKEYMSSGIKRSGDLIKEIKSELLAPTIPLPPFLSNLTRMTKRGGLKQGTITNIIADTSVGKSTFVNSLVYFWIFNAPRKVGVVSLEATAGSYGLEMLSTHLEKNLEWAMKGEQIVNYLDTPEAINAAKDLWTNDVGEDRWAILDERDGDITALEKCIERLIYQYNCGIIVVDVLSDILRGSNEAKQEDHMRWQKRVVKEGISIINVLHTRKPSDSSGEFRKATEYDALGSGTFVQSADCNIVLNRNKMSRDDIVRNTTEVDMPKIRKGITGHVGKIYYDRTTMSFWDFDEYFEKHPIDV